MKFETFYNEQLDEKLLMGTHKSGLRIAVVPKKGFCKSYAIYGTEYGSIDSEFIALGETKKTVLPDGVAHFLEHKLFEMPDGTNAFDRFAQIGGNSNAFTGFNITAYLFSCTDSFYENLDALLEFVNTPYFTDENVAKEQGIIAQEIKMYDDDPQWRVFFNMLSAMFNENPVKKDIAGTVESISRITPELLYKCTDTFYNPSNMFLVLVGDIDETQIEKYADKYIKDKKENVQIERFSVKESKNRCQEFISQKLSVSTPMFSIGFKESETGVEGYELLKKEIATEIILEILFGKSSKNFIEMYEKGLIDASFGVETELEKEYGFTSLGGESKEPKTVYNEVKKYIDFAIENGFSDDEIIRIKKAILSDEIRMYNSVESIGNTYIKSLMKGINPLDYTKAIDEIDKEYLQKRLKEHFDTNNSVLSVIYPLESENE